MLGPAERALVAHDPALEALALVLDPDALLDRLRERLPADVTGARLAYLRYKPGTNVRAAYDLLTPRGTRLASVQAWARAGSGKAAALRGPDDVAGVPWSPVVDAVLRVAVAPAESDVQLRGIAAVAARPRSALPPGAPRPCVVPLRYKPERRWVARADIGGQPKYLVKVHRTSVAAATAAVARRLRSQGAPVADLAHTDRGRGIVTSAWVPGRPLSARTPDDAGRADDLRAVAEALAALHAVPPSADPRRRDLAAVVTAAARAVGTVLPDARRPAFDVTRRLLDRWSAVDAGVRATVHGDMSADQVVLTPGGAVLLDLDRCRADDPAADIASWVAAEVAGGRDLAGTVADLRAAYEAAGGAPLDGRLPPLLAAALVLRAPEPFRLRQPRWPEVTRHLLDAAAAVVEEPA